ncbi:PhnD/SsuA/transferrin family substrate-binding protein, partial [Tumidithrix elongata RA019]|nr:PhnD/SsuA/transferrin family substrate-binding protein [Tumidithrix elongata RA019]
REEENPVHNLFLFPNNSNLLRYQLVQRNLTNGFFGSVQPSGSHQRSLQWIATGLADCAAIDSVVLEEELRHSSELAKSLRIIDSIPSPMPPIVASPHLEPHTIAQLQAILLQPDPELQASMNQAKIRSYARVAETDYAPIALAYDAAIAVGYEAIA